MHRKVVSILLTIHLLFMMLVASFNSNFDLSKKGMIFVAVLGIYTILLIIYIRRKSFYSVVLTGLVLYFLLNLAAYAFLSIDPVQSQKKNSIIIFSTVFIPGLYSSLAYFIFMMKDRKEKKTIFTEGSR